jgi:hypothetical protein
MLTNALPQAQMLAYFARDAALLKDAVWVPLGAKVGLALDRLAGARGVLKGDRILRQNSRIPHARGIPPTKKHGIHHSCCMLYAHGVTLEASSAKAALPC